MNKQMNNYLKTYKKLTNKPNKKLMNLLNSMRIPLFQKNSQLWSPT